MKRNTHSLSTRRAALLCSLLGTLWAGTAVAQMVAQPAQAAATPVTIPINTPAISPTQVQQFTLANGLTVIVRPDRRAPTVAHMLWVRVGSMDEVDGTSGVAHALEHMMFKGTPTLAEGEFSRRVAALGGRENAFTSRDATAYHQQVPASQLEAVMRLEADRFANNRWADDAFTREMEVIKEERRQRTEESPRARLIEALNAAVFQASPYRRPIIGWMSDLDAMTADDVRQFYQRWYVPNNAALVVAGDVNPDEVRALAEKYFGQIPARALPVRKPRQEPVQAGPRRLEYRAAAEQAWVVLAFKVPQWTGGNDAASQDALALTVLSAVLDGYSGARLERALVQGQGRAGQRLADSVSASNGLLGRGPQLFMLSAVPAAGISSDAAAAALTAEVQRIAQEGISEAELQRVKTQWMAAEVYKLDSVFNQAREWGHYWVNGLDVNTGDRLLSALRSVTAAQVQSVAQRYFSDEQLTTAVLVPDPSRRSAAPAGQQPRPALRH